MGVGGSNAAAAGTGSDNVGAAGDADGAVWRTAARPVVTHGGAWMYTPMGWIPTDLIRQALRGVDLLAVMVGLSVLLS